METLDVQAKDFLVKWVNASDNTSIKWQVKSFKKSINFAIYQKQDTFPLTQDSSSGEGPLKTDSAPVESIETFSAPASASRLRSTSVTSINTLSRSSTFKTRSRSSTFASSLGNSGLTLVKDYHKLLPDELVRGVYKAELGGTFAFIFDNTFSKTTSKKVFFSAKLYGKDFDNDESDESSLQQYKNQLKLDQTNLLSQHTKADILWPKDGELMQGILSKKRRKKLQGFTKRFFILNFKYGTLSYFKNNDNKLRGQMPITESIISADFKTNQIFIDSGMEVWNLKALSSKDLKAWVQAFGVIKKKMIRTSGSGVKSSWNRQGPSMPASLKEVENKINRLLVACPTESRENLEAGLQSVVTDVSGILKQLSISDAASVISDSEFFDANENLDTKEAGYGIVLMTEPQPKLQSRSDDESLIDNDIISDKSSSESEVESEEISHSKPPPKKGSSVEIGFEDVDLYPLPSDAIKRNCDIPICNHTPPSLLSFVRKNVGKDLSSLSMPVDMNEPITILQKYAEIFEYSDLIDNALKGDYPEDSGEFILRIAAFAISYLAAMRVKVRSTRKPFNPLLGETYELVREDKGFRLISEKVSHRPPVFAIFGESQDWTLAFSPAPSQKFWGKTSELYTTGNVKLTIRKTGEQFIWSPPTLVLKNIIAGEKFTEPSTSMTIKSSSGQKAVVDFAKGGMFSGRSEEVTIKAFDSVKNELPYCVFGKWTESMTLKTHSTEKVIWTAGQLLPQSEKKFGFTEYAGTLNKITSLEDGKLPPTDSRFRPDMHVYEEGKVSDAEVLKQRVEEGQRERRKFLEDQGEMYEPIFFEQVGGDVGKPETGEWVYKKGGSSYWERRKNNDWEGIPHLW